MPSKSWRASRLADGVRRAPALVLDSDAIPRHRVGHGAHLGTHDDNHRVEASRFSGRRDVGHHGPSENRMECFWQGRLHARAQSRRQK